MVRILACKSMARGIYSIGWEGAVLCYKEADESRMRCCHVLPPKSIDRGFRSERSFVYGFELSFRAERHTPAIQPVRPTPGDEVSRGEAGRSRAGRGASQRSPFRPRGDHRSRK